MACRLRACCERASTRKHSCAASAPTDLEERLMNNDEPDSPKEASPQDPSFVHDLRSSRKILALGLYPGDIHPGLLSGVGVDDQDRKFGVDKTIFTVTATVIVGFVVWGILSPESVASVASAAFDWAMQNMGWLLNLTMGLGLFVM